MIDIIGYVTKLHGKNGFEIKVTSDKVQHLSFSDIQVSKEVRVFIDRYHYPSDDDSEFEKITGEGEYRRDKINNSRSLSNALRKGDRVECSVFIVESETRNRVETHKIKRNRKDIETYADFPLWLYPDPDSDHFKRLEVDSRESLKFRKQWRYTCINREKYEKITGSKWNDYRNKPWINKPPKLIFSMLWGVRFRTAATKLWGYYKDPKNTTITRIIATISPLIAFASLILNIWLFFFRNP